MQMDRDIKEFLNFFSKDEIIDMLSKVLSESDLRRIRLGLYEKKSKELLSDANELCGDITKHSEWIKVHKKIDKLNQLFTGKVGEG